MRLSCSHPVRLCRRDKQEVSVIRCTIRHDILANGWPLYGNMTAYWTAPFLQKCHLEGRLSHLRVTLTGGTSIRSHRSLVLDIRLYIFGQTVSS
jgi:hypothetical protein